MRKSDNDIVTIGIDSSTRSIGVAIYVNGEYADSFVKEFPGTFSFEKLKTMLDYFNELFIDLTPDIVLIEEPIAARNGRVTRHLNIVGGAIFSSAYTQCLLVDFVNISTWKHIMGVKNKQDSLEKARLICKRDCSTDDESDAILIVESYKKLYANT